MSPTARSLHHMRALGSRAEVVEKTIPKTFIKQDMFGVDILALKACRPILAIQCISGAHVAACVRKLTEQGFIDLRKSVGASIEVWGWAKQGPRGERKTWGDSDELDTLSRINCPPHQAGVV